MTTRFYSTVTIFVLIILLTLTSQKVDAQDTQTLFNGDVSHGGFGAPAVKFSSVDDQAAIWVGGRGGWIINASANHALSIGGAGYGLVTEHRVPDESYGTETGDYYAMNGYGGLEFIYTNRSYSLVHLTFSTLIGAGGLLIRDENFVEIDTDSEAYFVLEPGAGIEINVTHFFRLAAGVNYLWTSGIGHAGFRDSDFSGVNGEISLKFGKFLPR